MYIHIYCTSTVHDDAFSSVTYSRLRSSRTCASSVEAPKCGVQTSLGCCSSSLLDSGGGSALYTSNAADATYQKTWCDSVDVEDTIRAHLRFESMLLVVLCVHITLDVDITTPLEPTV